MNCIFISSSDPNLLGKKIRKTENKKNDGLDGERKDMQDLPRKNFAGIDYRA